MAKAKISYEEFKKSMASMSGDMTVEQLQKANKTLEKIESSIKRETLVEGIQEKTLIGVNKSLAEDGHVSKVLKDIKKSLGKDGELYKSQAKASKDLLAELKKQYKPLNRVTDEKPVSVKEGLKSVVAGAKSAANLVGSKIKGAYEAVKNPGKTLKGAISKVENKINDAFETAYYAGEDVLGTSKDYTVKRGRFAQEGVKAGNFKTEEEGIKAAKRLEKRQNVAEARKAQMDESEKYGFVNEKTRSKFQRSLEKAVADDPRLKTANVQTSVPEQASPNIAPVAKPLTEPVVQKEAEKAAEASRAENPEADNIKDSQEIIADNSKEDLQLSKDLLKATQEQLDVLKSIKETLSERVTSKDSKKESEASANAPVEQAGGGLINAEDFLSNLPGRGGKGAPGKPSIPKPTGPAGKPSLGGRIKGGIKGLGGKLMGGIGEVTAGGLAGGLAAGAVTIGGGLALNYGLTKGADALVEATGADTNITPEMEAQDQKNWDKASFWEKAQSGVARGVEGVGSFLGADKTVAAAKAARIKNETEYLNEKEATAKPTESITGKKQNAGGSKLLGDPDEVRKAAFEIGKKELPNDPSGGLNLQAIITDKLQEKFPKLDYDYLETQAERAAMVIRENSKSKGNKTESEPKSGEPKSANLEQGQVSAVNPTTVKPSMKADSGIAEESVKRDDLTREATSSKQSSAPVIMNNSSSSSTTKVVPMKADPRPNSRGSALDRYIDRTSTF